MNIVNIVIKKIKGEQYLIDSAVPMSYLLHLICEKSLSLIWGGGKNEDIKTCVCESISHHKV